MSLSIFYNNLMSLYKAQDEVTGTYVLKDSTEIPVLANVINVYPNEAGEYWVEYTTTVDGYTLKNKHSLHIETFLSIYEPR